MPDPEEWAPFKEFGDSRSWSELADSLATLTAPEITRRLSFLYGKIDGLKNVYMVMVQELAKRKEEEGGGGSSSSDAPHSKAAPPPQGS